MSDEGRPFAHEWPDLAARAATERMREGAALATRNLAEKCAGWEAYPSTRMTKAEMCEFMASIASHLRYVADLLLAVNP